MKNPLLDAIKNMKAKRIAIVVGDADELGLPDMVQEPGMLGSEDAEGEEMEMEADGAEEIPDADLARGEDESKGSDLEGDEGGDDEEYGAAASEPPADTSEAEKVMGRKPFAGKNAPAAGQSGEGGDGEMPEAVAKGLYDENYANRMASSGRKPNGLFARAQMNLHKRFGGKK